VKKNTPHDFIDGFIDCGSAILTMTEGNVRLKNKEKEGDR
jgi:hypothetical protein